MFKRLGIFAVLAVCLFAIVIVMGGCGGDDPPPIIDPPPPPEVSLVSVSPEEGSEIKADATITVTFDGAPEGLKVTGRKASGGSSIAMTVTTEGSTVTISGPFPSLHGKIYLEIEWIRFKSSGELAYFVVPDLTGSYTLDAMEITRPAPDLAGWVLPLVDEDEPVTGTLTLTQDNRFSMSVTRPGHGTARGLGSWQVDSDTLTLITAPGSNFGGKYSYQFDGNELSLSTSELVISNAPSGERGRLWWKRD